MGCVLCECLGDSVPPSPRCPSPPCSLSSLPKGCGNQAAEGGDSRELVDEPEQQLPVAFFTSELRLTAGEVFKLALGVNQIR